MGGNPILLNDPSGLIAPAIVFGVGKVVAMGIAYVGVKLAQQGSNAAGADISNQDINQAFKTIGAINAAEIGVMGGVNAMVAASPAVRTALLANPATIQNTADFIQGAFVPGPPPPSPGGYLGGGIRAGYNYLNGNRSSSSTQGGKQF